MVFWPKAKGNNSPANDREVLNCLALFLLAFLAYANTLVGSFVYDDNYQVVENPYAHSFRYLPKIFSTSVWSFQGAQGPTNYFRPMMTFGYLLFYQIAGAVPFSFHLANIVLHALIVLLVFFILRRLSGERIALVAAGLFALHPIHTESVAWIAGVTDLELAFFYLLAFLLYLRLEDPDSGFGTRIAMCASFALALLSKEQAITLPLLATLFEHLFRKDRELTSTRQKFSRYAPLWATVALYLVVRGILLGGVASIAARQGVSWYEIGLSAITLTGAYLWKLLWPSHLSAFYVFHKSSHLYDRGVLLGLLGIFLCVVLFVLLWRHVRVMSFALVMLFLPLAPVLNARWMSASVFAERYLYVPSIGFCWLLAWAAVSLWRSQEPIFMRSLSRAVPVLLCAIAFPYGVKTVMRNRDWRSEEVLFKKTLEQGDASLIRNNLGAIYFNRSDYDDAEQEWLEALAAGPENVFALDNLALLRHRQKRYAESLEYSERALRARRSFVMAHLNFAETLADMGRTAEADWQFRIATAISPLSTRAHNTYGEFLFNSERLDDARLEFERSMHADPTADAYNRLGDIYLLSQDSARAEQAFRQAISLDPFNSHAHFGLGQVLEAKGKPGDALHEFETGMVTDPTDAIAKAATLRLRGGAPPQSTPR
jgi:Tfp pilus assembly protein PilF